MINRQALVTRHNPTLKDLNLDSPLSVGNGEFVFTADITGLQTFSELYKDRMPLCTQSQWGWHTFPVKNRVNYSRHDLRLKYYETYGRKVGYGTSKEEQTEIYDWLRQNPHRLHLGEIGLHLVKSNKKSVEVEDIEEISQILNIWEGILSSSFMIEGLPVKVKTICHPERDLIAVSIESELIKQQRLAVDFRFPYGSPDKTSANWMNSEAHTTKEIYNKNKCHDFVRILDDDHYFFSLKFSAGVLSRNGRHLYRLEPEEDQQEITFICEFSPVPIRQSLPDFKSVVEASKAYWSDYWNRGMVFCRELDWV